jgi:hypothetical protein
LFLQFFFQAISSIKFHFLTAWSLVAILPTVGLAKVLKPSGGSGEAFGSAKEAFAEPKASEATSNFDGFTPQGEARIRALKLNS